MMILKRLRDCPTVHPKYKTSLAAQQIFRRDLIYSFREKVQEEQLNLSYPGSLICVESGANVL